MLQCAVVCCSVLQCDVVCCSVLQCVGNDELSSHVQWDTSQYDAMCCMLQCVAVCRRVAACYIVLQCVAGCCSALQCVAVCRALAEQSSHVHWDHSQNGETMSTNSMLQRVHWDN